MLTTKETLALLGVSRSTLYAMIDAHELEPMRERAVVKNQPLKFRRGDVERVIAVRGKKAEQEAE